MPPLEAWAECSRGVSAAGSSRRPRPRHSLSPQVRPLGAPPQGKRLAAPPRPWTVFGVPPTCGRGPCLSNPRPFPSAAEPGERNVGPGSLVGPFPSRRLRAPPGLGEARGRVFLFAPTPGSKLLSPVLCFSL